jgi:hypothetical protein
LIDLFATDFIMIHKPFCLEKDWTMFALNSLTWFE